MSLSLRLKTKKKIRLVVCQGPLQLLVAIFVLEFRREKKIEDQEWEDYLLIGESYGSQELEILVREISKIWCFSGIIDIRDLSNAEKRDKAVRMLRRNFPP